MEEEGGGEVLHILLILHVLIISFHLVRYKNGGTVLEFIQIILANNNLSFFMYIPFFQSIFL